MLGDNEQYKYLTNEADLNNVVDESIALTPKTPKREEKQTSPDTQKQELLQQTIQQQPQQQQHQPISDSISIPQIVTTEEPSQQQSRDPKKIAHSLGNMSVAESMDGSYYGMDYDSNRNAHHLESDNIPIEARPKAAGLVIFFVSFQNSFEIDFCFSNS
jgi:hypothetical protein